MREFLDENNLPYYCSSQKMSDDMSQKIYDKTKEEEKEQLNLSKSNNKSIYNNPDFYENGKFIGDQDLNIILPPSLTFIPSNPSNE